MAEAGKQARVGMSLSYVTFGFLPLQPCQGVYSIMAARTIGGIMGIGILNGTPEIGLINKYMCRVQNDRTPMPHLLAKGIRRNNVTCALAPVVRFYIM